MASKQIGKYAAILACCPESKHHYNGDIGYWESCWMCVTRGGIFNAPHNLILPVEQPILQLCEWRKRTLVDKMQRFYHCQVKGRVAGSTCTMLFWCSFSLLNVPALILFINVFAIRTFWPWNVQIRLYLPHCWAKRGPKSWTLPRIMRDRCLN